MFPFLSSPRISFFPCQVGGSALARAWSSFSSQEGVLSSCFGVEGPLVSLPSSCFGITALARYFLVWRLSYIPWKVISSAKCV